MTQQQIQKPASPKKTEDEVIEELRAPVTSEVDRKITDDMLDEIEQIVATSDTMSDDLLLAAVVAEKVETVPATGRSIWQSHQARAWTRGGSVD